MANRSTAQVRPASCVPAARSVNKQRLCVSDWNQRENSEEYTGGGGGGEGWHRAPCGAGRGASGLMGGLLGGQDGY